jgi:hypothetical protein
MNAKRKPRARAKQPGTMRTKPHSTSTTRAKAALERALNLLSDLRRGKGSYSALLRKHCLSTRTAHKYLGRDLLGGTRGKPVRASKADRRVRILMFPQAVGDIPIRTRSSRAATKLSQYFHDRDKLLRGQLSPEDFEANWCGVIVAGQEVFADSSEILAMADADVLKLENLYASTAGER